GRRRPCARPGGERRHGEDPDRVAELDRVRGAVRGAAGAPARPVRGPLMDYVLHVLVMVALYAILASSFNLLIGYAGLFALSHAAFFGIGAYATAIVALKLGLPFPIPLLIGLAVT